MLERKPLAPNNRNGRMNSAFLQSLESGVTYVKYPKAREEARIKVYGSPGRPTSEGAFGGGNRVTR